MFWMRKPIVIKTSSVICMSNNKNGTGQAVQGTKIWIVSKTIFLFYVRRKALRREPYFKRESL